MNFHFDAAVETEIVITISDVTGKVVLIQKVPGTSAGSIVNLDLTGYPSGTYFYSLKTGDKIGNGKLMVTE